MSKTTFAVIHADEFVGTWLVKHLLDADHHVRALVHDYSLVDLFQTFPKADSNLSLYNVNLANGSRLREVLEGCDGVFFLPLLLHSGETEDPEAWVTRGRDHMNYVLQAVAATPSVKKLVVTSDVGVLMSRERATGELFDVGEHDRPDFDFLRKYRKTQTHALALADAALWQFKAAHNPKFHIACVYAGLTLGPLVHPDFKDRLPSPLVSLRYILEGRLDLIPEKNLPLVDVRDVARINMMLYDKRTLDGVFLAVAGVFSVDDIIRTIKRLDPAVDVPTESKKVYAERAPMGTLRSVDNSKLMSYGFHFAPTQDIVRDSMRSLKQNQLYATKTSKI